MKNKVTSVYYCCLLSKGFPETPLLSPRLYCLETMPVFLASAINERQILYFILFYFVYSYMHGAALLQFLIHKLTSTRMLCYPFLFLYIFHVCLACFKVRVGILFHTHSFESTGYVIHSRHFYLYIVS